MARVDDPDHVIWLANDLVSDSSADTRGPVVLVQVGRPSALALDMSKRLEKAGRKPLQIVITDRVHAQSESTLGKLNVASAAWIFADDLFEAFLTLFATPLAFALRAKAKEGFPVVALGHGALALGGLLLANRICGDAKYDLVAGLGWAPRVLFDGVADQFDEDYEVARTAVKTLPGLLLLDLGASGGVSVKGGLVQSVGAEPITLIGAGENDALLMMALGPGMATTIVTAPFAPFEQGLLPPATLSALSRDGRASGSGEPLRHAPPPSGSFSDSHGHAEAGSGRLCPMCGGFHAVEPKPEPAKEQLIELAA